MTEIGFDKCVKITIQHRIDIPGFIIGTEVLDQLIRLKDIGTDLIAPRDIGLFTGNRGCLFLALLLGTLIQRA